MKESKPKPKTQATFSLIILLTFHNNLPITFHFKSKLSKHFANRISQLYEQGADEVRIGEYVRHWLRWVRAGVAIHRQLFKVVECRGNSPCTPYFQEYSIPVRFVSAEIIKYLNKHPSRSSSYTPNMSDSVFVLVTDYSGIIVHCYCPCESVWDACPAG